MRLHNQGKRPLSWTMSAHSYECEPWGSVEVLDVHVDACKRRGLPLAGSPVPPGERASRQIADAEKAEKADTFKAIRREADSAIARADSEKRERDELSIDLQKVRNDVQETLRENAKMEQLVAEERAAKQSAVTISEEMAAKAADAEERAIKAEAARKVAVDRLAELEAPTAPAKPPPEQMPLGDNRDRKHKGPHVERRKRR